MAMNGRWDALKTIGTWLMWLTTFVVLLLRGGSFGGELTARVDGHEARLVNVEETIKQLPTREDIAALKHQLDRIEDRLDRGVYTSSK